MMEMRYSAAAPKYPPRQGCADCPQGWGRFFGPVIYPQRKLPVYKTEQRQQAIRYDKLARNYASAVALAFWC